MIYIDDEIFERHVGNPMALALEVCTITLNSLSEAQDFNEDDCTGLEEAEAVLLAVNRLPNLGFTYHPTPLENNRIKRAGSIFSNLRDFKRFLETRQAERNALRVQEHAARMLGTAFSYEFTSGDLTRIQTLIDETRHWLTETKLYSDEHKARLLKRLESLQSELHKKVSDLDRFWGFVGDAGIAIGKFGKDAKPFVDRIREMTEIVFRTQSHTEQLPSDTPPPRIDWDGKE